MLDLMARQPFEIGQKLISLFILTVLINLMCRVKLKRRSDIMNKVGELYASDETC